MNFSIQTIRQFWTFCFKSSFSKQRRKCKTCRFLGVTWFTFWLFCANLFSIWHVLTFSIQNMTRCIFYFSKPDTLKKFSFKIRCIIKFYLNSWQFVSVWFRNLMHLELLNSKCNALYITKLKKFHELRI